RAPACASPRARPRRCGTRSPGAASRTSTGSGSLSRGGGTHRGWSSPRAPRPARRRWSARWSPPSPLRSSVRLPEEAQPVHGRFDGAVRGLAEPADGRVLHGRADLREERQLAGRIPAAVADEPVQRLLLPHRADAAGHALAAGLVAEEARDAQQRVAQVHALVEHHHHARAERDARRPRALEREHDVELIAADEGARGAAEQHGLDGMPRRPAGKLDERAERRAERHLVDARPPHGARDAEEPRARGFPRAHRRERRGALEDDVRNVRERLDVVDDGGLTEEARLDRERRLVARLAAVPLDRVDESGLLAADVRAGALAELDVEAEAATGNVVAEPSVFPGALDRVGDALGRERVLAADVDVAAFGADSEARDRQRLDDRERIALEQDAVLERAGLGLVCVADDVTRFRRLPCDGFPFPAGGERGAAP